MALGKFMLFNGIATLVAVKIGIELDASGRTLGIGALVYFWCSLYFYSEWFCWNSDIHGMTDAVLQELLDEWVSGGPFGRNTTKISRIMFGKDIRKKFLGARRLALIYEELARRGTNGNQVRLAELLVKKQRWTQFANEYRHKSTCRLDLNP